MTLWRNGSMPNDTTDTIKDPSTMSPIAAIADNQEHLVQLPNTIHDPALTKSIITKHYAFATQGRIKPIQAITLTTSTQQCYSSSSTITLRWRHNSGLQSYQETFYIVDSIDHDFDAILRKDIKRSDDGDGKATPTAFPVLIGKHDKKGKEDAREREHKRAERDKEYQRQVEQQKKMIKAQIIKGR